MGNSDVIYIAHRINTVEELQKIPKVCGVEVDLRDWGERLILQHDPFLNGEDFESYLQHYRHRLILLNIKSEQIEGRVLDLLKKYNIADYFFLDSSFGMTYLLTKEGEKNVALRFSEFEGLDTVLTMQQKAKWVWIDCFTKFPLNKKSFSLLKRAGFKLCLVSPELHGRPGDIEKYNLLMKEEAIEVDAICTKAKTIAKWHE